MKARTLTLTTALMNAAVRSLTNRFMSLPIHGRGIEIPSFLYPIGRG
jgi:hypothetical protein